MSGFLGIAQGSSFTSGLMLQLPLENTRTPDYVWTTCGQQVLSPWQPGNLWAPTKLSGSDANGGLFGLDSNTSGTWGLDLRWESSGGQQMKKIIGTCRDSTGAALGSCIVQGFRASDDLIAGQMTCDPAGYFEFCTPYTTAHYLVAYKAGSPDVAGTTVNTLIPV